MRLAVVVVQFGHYLLIFSSSPVHQAFVILLAQLLQVSVMEVCLAHVKLLVVEIVDHHWNRSALLATGQTLYWVELFRVEGSSAKILIEGLVHRVVGNSLHALLPYEYLQRIMVSPKECVLFLQLTALCVQNQELLFDFILVGFLLHHFDQVIDVNVLEDARHAALNLIGQLELVVDVLNISLNLSEFVFVHALLRNLLLNHFFNLVQISGFARF